MSETATIAEMANKVSQELFQWFKWERVPLMDQDFKCVKSDKHAPTKKTEHTHPVDVVLHYVDPYINKRVLLNTDLKSYSNTSIQTKQVRSALKSLAKTIDCARVSQEWKSRYSLFQEPYEIRGLLFVYNHDGEFDKSFLKFFDEKKPKSGTQEDEAEDKSVSTERLPLEGNQLIHVVEPRLISYMSTILADVHRLHAEGSFPVKDYYFHYPDLKLHKTSGAKATRPATIEMIAGPFLTIEHSAVKKYDETSGVVEDTYPAGYVIYYNRPGRSHLEFMYLFDTLSNYQILDGSHPIRIRVAHYSPANDVRSNFEKAINSYVQDWGFDDYKKNRLKQITIDIVEITKTTFSKQDIGWDRKK